MNPKEANNDSLFTLDISNTFGSEYKEVMYDISRAIIIQLSIQTLLYLTDKDNHFFSMEFLILCIYIALGVFVYWMIFKKLVSFE